MEPDAWSSPPAARWHSAAMRRLHNQVGHAFRQAAKDAHLAPFWKNGVRIAGHVSCWAKSLDAQLASGTFDAPCEEKHRVLTAQVSDDTVAPPEEDTVSCAPCNEALQAH